MMGCCGIGGRRQKWHTWQSSVFDPRMGADSSASPPRLRLHLTKRDPKPVEPCRKEASIPGIEGFSQTRIGCRNHPACDVPDQRWMGPAGFGPDRIWVHRSWWCSNQYA